jgi:5-(carboxyamino)imidazole ribonucleotide synthase
MFARSPLSAGFRIGFIGGGQLAAMSAQQAFRFGMDVAVYAASADEPLCRMTPLVSIGQPDDIDALAAFAATCDVLTLENEFMDSAVLTALRDCSGTPLFPTPESFDAIGDKINEKRTFSQAGIPVADWRHIHTEADLARFGDDFGWPFILKSAKGGYDGYGNATAYDLDSARKGFANLGGDSGRPVLAEALIPFTKELAVMVARNEHGVAVYTCAETIQENHICKMVIAPAPIPLPLRRQAQELAVAAMEAVQATGIFGFEFFLTADNRLILNESAPRPHNSGHYSIEGCVTSQFENHVRAVCQLPLGSAELRRPAAVMVNLLGTHARPVTAEGIGSSFSEPDAHVHIYGKRWSKPGRKMGHLTVLGDDAAQTLERAQLLAKSIQI